MSAALLGIALVIPSSFAQEIITETQVPAVTQEATTTTTTTEHRKLSHEERELREKEAKRDRKIMKADKEMREKVNHADKKYEKELRERLED